MVCCLPTPFLHSEAISPARNTRARNLRIIITSIIIPIKRTRIHYLFSLASPSWLQIIAACTVCAAKHVTISIKKSGSNSKSIGFVFCCKIDHIWSFLKWFKQWRLHACKIPMTTEAANLKLGWVWSNEHYYSFKIFPRFWLAKSTRIIHHNQLRMTKFGRILCLTRKWRQKCSVFAG